MSQTDADAAGAPDFDAIVEDMTFLDDWEDRYRYVIDLGKAMPPMDEALKTPATKVDGCASQVWIAPRREGDRLDFIGDSDAMIVRGLIAVLHALYAGKTDAEILAVDAQGAFRRLGLDQALSSQRSNGLRAMVERLRGLAAQG
ncbi:SufE family protein [Rubrimonas cliftonensis]|uniref:Cysteine desulfuration protein SufE n=1 Tax=Rubrimonas cliftonensis TaxID=89524 RepID=A0A1H4AEZ0_9RHOB|nr:Cysteine desulfuration protein SufE [Rubrimonas cliftonensis]